jgi:hypothetical protein
MRCNGSQSTIFARANGNVWVFGGFAGYGPRRLR